MHWRLAGKLLRHWLLHLLQPDLPHLLRWPAWRRGPRHSRWLRLINKRRLLPSHVRLRLLSGLRRRLFLLHLRLHGLRGLGGLVGRRRSGLCRLGGCFRHHRLANRVGRRSRRWGRLGRRGLS